MSIEEPDPGVYRRSAVQFADMVDLDKLVRIHELLDAHYEDHPEDRPSTVDLACIQARESGHADLTAEQLTAAHDRLVATNPHPPIEEVVAYALGAAHGVAV